MTDYDASKVRSAISTARLARYVDRCNGCEDNALTLYGFNMALCEAFYTPLQCVEVCLRNSLHDAMSKGFGSHWMTNGGPPLDADAEARINGAIDDRKQSGKPTNPPDIVAEIGFSFWVGLLGTRYDSTLWRTTLHSAFVGSARSQKRKAIHGRFNAIRRFRNRVAHHEPILDRNVPGMHQEIISAIEWLSPDKAKWALGRSKVPDTYAEFQAFLASLLPQAANSN